VSSHVIFLPFSKKVNNKVSSEFLCKNLREEVKVANECGLENDGNVRGIEKLNWVWLLVTLHLSAGNSKFNSETL
jgi:hypothetical protein